MSDLLIRLFTAFVKITGWPVQFFCFRTKIHRETEKCSRRIRGPAIIISNHTSVFDYAVWMFVFFSRTLRFQMAEVLFKIRFLGLFLRMLGGIFVDRDGFNFSFVAKSEDILRRGGVVGIFPESRLPRPGEERPLEFKTSAAFIALRSGVPVIPVVTDGSYFGRKRAHVMIGEPIDVRCLSDKNAGEKEDLINVSRKLRERIIELENKLNEEKK